MRANRIVPAAAAAVLMSTVLAPVVQAQDDVAINGTFTAFSDGGKARLNDSYHAEANVTQTWTITSTCRTYQDCIGRVTSDQGWSADLIYLSGRWKVSRVVENWEPCFDGTAYPGRQAWIFWLGYPPDKNRYIGWDKTEGPSGACGFNKVLDIEMPLTLTRIS